MKQKEMAHKFVSWEVPPLDTLKDTKAYKIRAKINRGEKLTREEKNILAFCGSYRHSIPVMGWMFDFADVLKTYLVKRYGQWNEYRAFDKTALRKALFGRIDRIVEIEN